jgi:hypothetical protein
LLGIGLEVDMRDFKLVTAAAVVCAGMVVTTTNLAAAQDYYVSTAQDCVPAPAPSSPPWRWYDTYYPNYFVADWGPFFRRHVYRYGPIVACSAAATPSVISSKY